MFISPIRFNYLSGHRTENKSSVSVNFAAKPPAIDYEKFSPASFLEKYSLLTKIHNLADLKKYFPEFKKVVDLADYKGSNPILQAIKSYQMPIFAPKSFSLDIIKEIYLNHNQSDIFMKLSSFTKIEVANMLKALNIDILPEKVLKSLVAYKKKGISNNDLPLKKPGKSPLTAEYVFMKLKDTDGAMPLRVKQLVQAAVFQGQAFDSIRNFHQKAYAGLKNCYSLEDVKRQFPEFEKVLSLSEVNALKGSFLDKVKNGQVEDLSPRTFTLELLRAIYFEMKSSGEIIDMFKMGCESVYTSVLKKLNIKKFHNSYAFYMKQSDPKYAQALAEKTSKQTIARFNENPELRQAVAKHFQEFYQDPENIAQKRKSTQRLWMDTSYRESQRASKMKPENRQQRREILEQLRQTEDYKAKISAGHKKSWAILDSEQRQEWTSKQLAGKKAKKDKRLAAQSEIAEDSKQQ